MTMDSELKSLLENEETSNTKSKYVEDKYQPIGEIEAKAKVLSSSANKGVWIWLASWVIGVFITGFIAAVSEANDAEFYISISIVSSVWIIVGILKAIKLCAGLLSNILQMQILDFKVRNGINDTPSQKPQDKPQENQTLDSVHRPDGIYSGGVRVEEEPADE